MDGLMSLMLTVLTYLLVGFGNPEALVDSNGYKFYLAFLDNSGPNGYVQLHITSKKSGSCVVSIQYLEIRDFISISTDSVNVYNISRNIDMNITGIEQKAVMVSCDVPVSIYAMNYYYAFSEGYLAIPYHALGRKYVVATFSRFNGYLIMLNKMSFGIVATEDNTDVTIILKSNGSCITYNGKVYQSNDSFSVILSHLETFYLTNVTDFSGTIITSTKPVAVFSGGYININRSSQYTDFTTEMIIPQAQLGKDFVIPVLYDSLCTYRVLSDRDVNITIHNGTTITRTIKEGQFYEDSNLSISTVKSMSGVLVQLYCYQIGTTCQDVMVTVPSIQHFKSEYKFAVASNYPLDNFPPDNFYITIIISSSKLSGLQLDNKSKISYLQVSNITFSGESYSVLSTELNVGLHKIQNVDNIPFGLIVYGRNRLDGYGYPAGLRLNH